MQHYISLQLLSKRIFINNTCEL